jgi:hypothetical protein
LDRSVASWKAWGGNGYKLDSSDNAPTGSFTDFGTKGLKAAGAFTIPLCTLEEAYANWGRIGAMDDNPNYPCNK